MLTQPLMNLLIMFEIKLGENNERTNREIKLGHNLEKMLIAGEFKTQEREVL